MFQIQYLGHSCVKITTSTHCLLVDPFLTGNPKAPCTWEEAAEGVTHILLTHGHADHVGDTVHIAKRNHIPVVAIVELANWLSAQGVEKVEDPNIGGTIDLGGNHSVTLVPAWHTSASNEGEYLGTPAGLIITTPRHTVYHAGDTAIFGDMALINELYHPSIGLLPIGGHYTMDAQTAAFAARKFFKFKHIIPIHYGTFPALAPNADAFVAAAQGLPCDPLHPGETETF